jgi:hypothetical protein
MKTSELLIKARALIANPENWTRMAFARDSEGVSVDELCDDAVCFCAVGAINRAKADHGYLGGDNPPMKLMRGVVSQCFKNSLISEFNDTRTHAEVMFLFDKTIAMAQIEGD